ncbi:MAG: hypothetical protein US53_C0037G0001, partial [Candidatus Woesebacteria bacterium GW2011_GWA1_37_7]
GNDIIKEFFVGRSGKKDQRITDISGKYIPGDSLGYGPLTAKSSALTPEELMDKIVLKEKVYAINLIVKHKPFYYRPDCENVPLCSAGKFIDDFDSYNAQVYEELSGQQINQEDDNSAISSVGWIEEIIIFSNP